MEDDTNFDYGHLIAQMCEGALAHAGRHLPSCGIGHTAHLVVGNNSYEVEGFYSSYCTCQRANDTARGLYNIIDYIAAERRERLAGDSNPLHVARELLAVFANAGTERVQ